MMTLSEFAKKSAENIQLSSKSKSYNGKSTAGVAVKNRIKGQKDLSRRYNMTTPYGT